MAKLGIKEDPNGEFWVIEPTVGRTDYWAGLCDANGVNLPLIEYLSAIGESVPAVIQETSHLWIDCERDPRAVFWLLRHGLEQPIRFRLRGVYFDLEDPWPAFLALNRYIGRLPGRAVGVAGRMLRATRVLSALSQFPSITLRR